MRPQPERQLLVGSVQQSVDREGVRGTPTRTGSEYQDRRSDVAEIGTVPRVITEACLSASGVVDLVDKVKSMP